MSEPASRFTDLCVCGDDMAPGSVVGPCAPDVFINSLPAARFADLCLCATGQVSRVAEGAKMVRINGRPAARMGAKTTNGGVLTTGSPSVFIGGAALSPPLTVETWGTPRSISHRSSSPDDGRSQTDLTSRPR